MAKICEKCGCGESGCRCETEETEEFTTDNGDDDDSFISLCSFPKTIPPEIILGITHAKLTLNDLTVKGLAD